MRIRFLICGLAMLAGTALALAADDKPKPGAEQPKRPNLDRLFEQNDRNKDGFIDKSEAPPPLLRRFEELDTNKDGKLSKAEIQKGRPERFGKPPAPPSPPGGRGQGEGGAAADSLFELLDTNKDGKLSKAELESAVKLVEKFDTNKDGALDRSELASALALAARREYVAPAARAERLKDSLKVGDLASDFTLPTLDGKKEVQLSSFRGQKPVVLVFASYT